MVAKDATKFQWEGVGEFTHALKKLNEGDDVEVGRGYQG